MELMQRMEQVRRELYELSSGKGYLDPEVLKKSLDESMKKPTA